MKHLAFLLCLAMLVVPSAFAAGVCTSNIGQDVLAPGFYCTLGPMLFQNFSASAIFFPVGFTPQIRIGVGVPGNMTGISGNYANLFFTTNFSPNDTLFRDVSFGFQVSGVVDGIDGWVGGTGPDRSIAESACSDRYCADIIYGFLGVDQDNPSSSIVIPPATNMWVFKNISMNANGSGQSSIVSEFSQSFHIPEPLTLVLVGSGLLGLGLLRRRMRA